jgi:hypothetical protein
MHRKSNSSGRPLPERIQNLRRELQAAMEKAERVRTAVETRRRALNRLEAAFALGESGPAPNANECINTDRSCNCTHNDR